MTRSDLSDVGQRVHVMAISVNTVINIGTNIGMDMTRSDLINVSADHGYISQHCDKYRF